MYFLLGGWRDKEAGFAWCTLQAFYEYLIVLKVNELKRHQSEEFAERVPQTVQELSILSSTLAEKP
jgi:hypothetical protein